MSERASALLGAVVVLACAAIALIVVVEAGNAAAERARAQTAADAAALAGAADGELAARDVAARNGAAIVSLRRDGSVVEVVVQHGRATASARAERIVEICRPGRPCERLSAP